MKLARKSLSTLLGLLALGGILGTLVWEVVERLAGVAGLPLDLSVGPLTLDVHALAVSVRGNPGSLVGLVVGALLFRAL